MSELPRSCMIPPLKATTRSRWKRGLESGLTHQRVAACDRASDSGAQYTGGRALGIVKRLAQRSVHDQRDLAEFRLYEDRQDQCLPLRRQVLLNRIRPRRA